MSELTRIRQHERHDLLITLKDLGPEVPTLCSRWTAADIAGHLAVSESALGLPMVAANALRRVMPARATRRAIDQTRVARSQGLPGPM